MPGETIVAAAIRCWKGLNPYIIVSVRHFDRLMERERTMMGLERQGCEQGFVTSEGRFVSREEALLIAFHRKQIKEMPENRGKLISEDLY